MSDSVWLHRRQPTRLPRPWDSPGKNTGVGCHFLLHCMQVKMKVKSLSRVRLLATPWKLQPTRLLRPWDFPGKSTGVGCHCLLCTSMWDECNCEVVWAFFGIAFLWDWNENWPFLVLWPLLSFPKLLAYWVQHYWNSFTGIPSPPLALFIMMLSKAHLSSHSKMSGSR